MIFYIPQKVFERYLKSLILNSKNLDQLIFIPPKHSSSKYELFSSIASICNKAFSNCCKLQKVDFLEKSRIKYFESKIFEDSKIKSLYIPSSVITLKRFWCKDTKYLIDVKISRLIFKSNARGNIQKKNSSQPISSKNC